MHVSYLTIFGVVSPLSMLVLQSCFHQIKPLAYNQILYLGQDD